MDFINDYITDEQVVKRVKAAVELDLMKKHIMDIPVSVYDSETGIIYDVDSNGNKIPVARRITKGRYSERVRQKA